MSINPIYPVLTAKAGRVWSKKTIKNSLELKKKDHIISAMKSFNAFIKTDKKKTTSPKKETDGLSDTERKIMRSIK